MFPSAFIQARDFDEAMALYSTHCHGRRAAGFVDAEQSLRLNYSAPAMLADGQALYDEIQRYLIGTPDSELPTELTDAFDRFEATWNAARNAPSS